MNKFLREQLQSDNPERKAARDGFGEGLLAVARIDERIVALCADLTESLRMQDFAKHYPNRFWNVGIMEQHMVSMAAGMALNGYVPFVGTYGVFQGRAWDQIRVSVCLTQANVKLVGSHVGVNVGPDGASAQALEDLSLFRALPHLTIVAPCDAVEARKATIALAEMNGPAYLRFGRSADPIITTEETPFLLGRAEMMRDGNDCSIVACGAMVYEALKAAEELQVKDNLSVRVINMHTIKPIDVATIQLLAKETGAIVIAEEHQQFGGLGSAVAEVVVKFSPVPMEFVGMNDSFGESGTPEQLREKYGFSATAIRRKVLKVIKRKR